MKKMSRKTKTQKRRWATGKKQEGSTTEKRLTNWGRAHSPRKFSKWRKKSKTNKKKDAGGKRIARKQGKGGFAYAQGSI